nr:aminotransferase class I/II-fold pyridoxal phosphate-dependent enzyme [Modestobacter caceresii]
MTAETGFLATSADLEAVRTPRTPAVVLASPANPSGSVYTADQLTDIAEWALAHDVWVVYDQFVYGANPDAGAAPHLLRLAPELRDRCLVVSGVSKAYAMTGRRIGWLAGPPAVVAAARKHVARTITHVPTITQPALTGDQQPVHEALARYRRNRDVLATALDGISGVRCPAPAGGMFVFPDVSVLLERGSWATTLTLATWLLEDAGVAVVPGEAFDAPGHVRLCFAVSPRPPTPPPRGWWST